MCAFETLNRQPESKKDKINVEQSYKKKPVTEKHVFKSPEYEPAFLREVDDASVSDFIRYKRIDVNPAALEFMVGNPMSTKEIFDMLENKDKDRIVFAVCSSKEESRREMEGWVQVVPEAMERIKRISDKGIKLPKDLPFWEISYARYMDPNSVDEQGEKGLIGSAVRQTCDSLPNLTITAYTNPKNIASERVLESSGFIKIGTIPYDEGAEEEDNFWVLNLDKLEEIQKRKLSHYNKLD